MAGMFFMFVMMVALVNMMSGLSNSVINKNNLNDYEL